MSDDTHTIAQESLGAHALGALPDDERDQVERHLAECARCRQDLAELRTAVEALPTAVPPAQPPPDLRERIMAVVESEAELLRAAGEGADRPHRRGPRAWFPRPAAAATAVAAALAAGVGVGAAVFTGGSSGPGARTVRAEQAPSTAAAYLRLAPDHADLVVRHMPPPPPGHVYEVWMQPPGGKPVPAGATFALRDGVVTLPGHVRTGERIMVTAEPRGGSRTPTSHPVIVTRIT